jgi:hypothetical protein
LFVVIGALAGCGHGGDSGTPAATTPLPAAPVWRPRIWTIGQKVLDLVRSGSITYLSLADTSGATTWEADVWDTYLVEHKVIINATSGALLQKQADITENRCLASISRAACLVADESGAGGLWGCDCGWWV